MDEVKSRDPFKFLGLNHIFGMAGGRHFTFCTLIDNEKHDCSACVIDYPQWGCVHGHVTSLKFGK